MDTGGMHSEPIDSAGPEEPPRQPHDRGSAGLARLLPLGAALVVVLGLPTAVEALRGLTTVVLTLILGH